MENNFPINEDLAYEKIRDLMFDMMEEDPNRLYALTDKLNELAALPKRTMTLVLDLMAATPFQVIIPKHVRKNDPDTFKADHETVSNVLFLGEFGGIAVELEPNEALREPRIISITMVEIPHRNPLRKRVNEYRKKRIKKRNSQAPPTFECYCQFYGESNLPFCACFFSFLSEFCGAGLISLNQWWDGSGCRP